MKQDEKSICQMIVSSSVGFECMMEHAEKAYNKNYSSYSFFEDDFKRHLAEWSPNFADYAWLAFSKNIDARLGAPIVQNLSHKGAFFEQVDYAFIFVFAIFGQKGDLEEIVSKLNEWHVIDGDDFCMAIDNIDKHFSPSYSGADKSHIWAFIEADGIEWPPKICDPAVS